MVQKNNIITKEFPADIVSDILAEEYEKATIKILSHYEYYMIKIATTAVWVDEIGIYVYHLDDDLLEEMRISLFKSVQTFHQCLIQKINNNN